VGSCHHGIARPRSADEGDGLQLLSVAANILNKQSPAADKGVVLQSGGWGTINTPP
jgi:hypothetical protein